MDWKFESWVKYLLQRFPCWFLLTILKIRILDAIDMFEELEKMAVNSLEEPEDEDRNEPSDEDIARWQCLFNYSRDDAASLIKERRKDYSRNRVSNEHWEIVQSEMEAHGYDREAYEYSLDIGRKKVSKNTPFSEGIMRPPPAQSRATYIFRLEGPLDTLGKVQDAAGMSELPVSIQGIGEDGEASFCRVNGDAKHAIIKWTSAQEIKYNPTFVRVSQAEKNILKDSMYPTLDLDTTPPQNRPVDRNTIFYPTQNRYPVWYFFYCTLCDSTILSHQLSLPGGPTP